MFSLSLKYECCLAQFLVNWYLWESRHYVDGVLYTPQKKGLKYVAVIYQSIFFTSPQFFKSHHSAKGFWSLICPKIYRKVTSSSTSHLKAHDDFLTLLIKGIFDPFHKKLIS